jgi:CRISPR-associated protein Csx3
MTSYQIRLEGDTLKVDFAKNADGEPISANGDRIVRDVAARLQEMVAAGELQGGNLLKIDGRISVLASYTLIHEIAHLYRAIAVSDTRLGAYVVAISTAPEYPVGSRIDLKTGEVKQVASICDSSPSFLIYWENDVLIAKINNGVKTDGDHIVRDAEAQLEKLISSGQLAGGKQLLINGRATVLASFAIANKVAHIYSSVAVFDPRLGDKGLDRYVVVINHGKDYQIGDTIDIAREPQPTVKVVLCGPPNTGKTVLRDGLKAAILNLNNAPADFYAISGCPDGDGAWYSETFANYPELARQLKEEYKAKFTREFALGKARDVKVIKNSLLLFDVGGRLPSDENKFIMSEATHAVILAKTEADVIAWEQLCEKHLPQTMPVIAILYSDRDGKNDEITCESPVLIGKVHHLERGQDVSGRPMVKALANLVVNLAVTASAISD